MRKLQRMYLFPALFAATVGLALSCGPRSIGYGLILWAPEGEQVPVQTGEVVEIIGESKIQESYRFRVEEEQYELPTWRFRFFPNREKADAGAEEYSSYLEVYGFAEKDGLPIREEPRVESGRIYKLRAGQLLKILDREEKKELITGYEDYWYRVLTEDGFEGYCFGELLTIFTARTDPRLEAQRLMARDPLLEDFFTGVWRPEYFQQLIEEGRIDLFDFNPRIGLFPNREERVVRLVTSSYEEVFRFDEVEGLGTGHYLFKGSDLRLRIDRDGRAVITYTRRGQLLSVPYIRFPGRIEEIVEAERERRRMRFDELMRRGAMLESTAYGSILLEEEMRFRWLDFERLQQQESQVFLKPVKGTGQVDFPYHLSPELSGRFDGVITFRFDEYKEREGSSFLYQFEPGGIRFMFVRPEEIDGQEVRRIGITPLVIYFRFGN